MNKQANASDMLIKEYKQQNVLLQNAISDSNRAIDKPLKKVEKDKTMNVLRTLSHTRNDEESHAESSPAARSPENEKRKKSKKARSRKTNKNSYRFSPVLCDSQNIGSIESPSDLREKISAKRMIALCESKDDKEEDENQDPSLVASSVLSHDDSMCSSSSFLGEQQRKSMAVRGSKRKRKIQKPDKDNSKNYDLVENPTDQRRSLRSSLRDRTSAKLMMPPSSSTKIENSFLSPLIENEGAITVTTTTTLSPQKSRVSFMTPQNKKKKLFNNGMANEVIHFRIFI